MADKLIAAGLVKEIKAKAGAPAWRRDEESGHSYALKLTAAGAKAIAVNENGDPARLVALFHNWWNIFVRLAEPDAASEPGPPFARKQRGDRCRAWLQPRRAVGHRRPAGQPRGTWAPFRAGGPGEAR